jgi:hypothetical protein
MVAFPLWTSRIWWAKGMTERSNASSRPRFTDSVRKHPVLFGSLVGVGVCLLLLVATLSDPRFADSYMKHLGWVRFIAYTAVLEGLLVKYCPSHTPLIAYWSIFGGLLMLHLVCSIWFILKVMPLSAIHYAVGGPFEFLLLYFLLSWGFQYAQTVISAH